jgi:DNA (cytosine-5)-methyltransferase 1
MENLNELELFAGAGGGILGSQLLGHRTICAVEYDAYARSVLLARQADRTFPAFPVWDDVRTFDGKPWGGIVDVVSGGFPCQDISVAGKGAGLDGERSGLWGEMARVVGEIRPLFVFVENSPALVTRGLHRVLGDLASLGYDSRWIVMGAGHIGANHERERLWILASDSRCKRHGSSKNEIRAGGYGAVYGCRWSSEPGICRVDDGVAHRTHRLKAIGNGQVPQCRAAAWKYLGGP